MALTGVRKKSSVPLYETARADDTGPVFLPLARREPTRRIQGDRGKAQLRKNTRGVAGDFYIRNRRVAVRPRPDDEIEQGRHPTPGVK